jgi:MipA family protein
MTESTPSGLLATIAFLATVIPASSAGLAQAGRDEGVSGGVGLGGALVPDYEGSDEYEPVPLASFEMGYKGFSVRSRGLGLAADVLPSPDWSAGPVMVYNAGRDDVEDEVVDRLADVDGGIEIGGFIGYQLPLGLIPQDGLSFNVELRQEVADGHDGLIGEGSVGYSGPVTERLRLTGVVSASVVDDSYSDAFFSVDGAGSAASGLPVYDADGGVKDVGLSLIGTYSLSESWSVNALAGYTRLVGDAADSPIVEERGSADQFILGLSMGYSF